MTKKKNRDFQKIKIKVGRKLKRQNETVVDLTRRKIKLPRERERDETKSDRPGFRIVDDAIESLNLEKSSVQLQALQTLNGILDPFVKQMGSMGYSDCSTLTMQSRSLLQLVSLYRTLFQFDPTAPDQFGFQLGSLSNTLFRLCRGAQDPHLCGALLSLFVKLIRICSLHPKFPEVLRTLDRCAIAVLQRVESPWLWFGCRLTGLVLQVHSQMVTAATLLGHVQQFVDPVEQLVRSSIFSRALVHLYRDLKEQQAVRDVSTHRNHLLEATLAYFLDEQYSMNVAYSSGCHPLCYRPPSLTGIQLSGAKPYLTLNGHSLYQFQQQAPFAHRITDFSLLDMEARALLMGQAMNQPIAALLPNLSKKAARKRSREQASNMNTIQSHSKNSGFSQLKNERALLFGMLEEGHNLLSELSLDSPAASLLSGIYSVVRCLRVVMESRTELLSSVSGESEKTSIPKALLRFISRLYSVFPIQPADSHLPETTNDTTVGSRRQLHAGLSRQEMRRVRKHNAKMKNREQNRTASQLKTQVPSTGSSTPTSKVSPIIHRVNQAVLELCPWLEWITRNHPGLWPPPEDTVDRFVQFLLDDVFGTDVGGVSDGGPSLGNLLAWLRAFDFYLLAPVRRPQQYCSTPSSTRLFVPVILLCLGRLLHRGLCSKQTDPERPLTRGQHRLLGRAVGLLVAFLTHEARQLSTLASKKEDSSSTMDSVEDDWVAPAFEYDESWLRKYLVKLDSEAEEEETCTSDKLISCVVPFLTTMILTEPPRLLFASPLSSQSISLIRDQLEQVSLSSSEAMLPLKHATPIQLVEDTWVSCFLRLQALKYKPALEALNPELETRLGKSKRFHDQLIPLHTLAAELQLAISEDVACGDQLGWLVPGYLPDTSGRYTAPAFWQTTKEYRYSYSWWTANFCK